ncbi:MAG TPA: hypothetical protein VGB79_05210 [Allosphingosinicella sp.]|jgi:uncharacterized protein YlxW (UPF0749 family)
MGPFEMVIGIVLITAVASIVKAKMGIRRDYKGNELPLRDDAETERLRAEVRQLKERLAVIERITIEKESSLEREIESLRHR